MSDFFWKKLNYLAGLGAIAVLFGLTAFSANLEIKDLDLWLHLRTGRVIVEQGKIPDRDILSCSITGKPWVNHEWLFQAFIYTIQHEWGFDGLITMQVVVVCLTFLILLLLTYRRDRQWLAVFALLLVLMVYQNRFTIRPDIFSLLFFSLYTYILALHLDKRWSVLALAFIQVLWVNMHGFFFIGPLLIGLGITAEFIKRRVPLPYEWNATGRLSDSEYKRLRHMLWFILLACLLNPLTFQGAWYPLHVLFQSAGESKIFFRHIYELKRPFATGLWDITENMHYKMLILTSFLSFFFNRRKMDIGVFMVWLVFLLFSLAAIRNVVFFSCAAYLVIMVNSLTVKLEDILPLRFSSPKFKEVTGIMAKLLLIFWMIDFGSKLADRGYFDYDKYERKSEYWGVSKRSFPYHAVDFLITNQIKGNFFNDFNSGAYLVGRVFPNIKVFIDGRTEVYGAEFFKTYQKVWGRGEKKIFDRLDQKCHFTGAFLNGANQSISTPAAKMFYGMKDWRLVYFNYDGMIFLKDVPQNRTVIELYGIDLAKWKAPPMDLQRLGPKRILPFPFLDRAQVLVSLRFDVPAMEEINAALKISPQEPEIYQLRGDVYARQKHYRKAFEDFRIACAFMPNRRSRVRLAWSYERLGDIPHALKHYKRLLEEMPQNAKIKAKVKQLNERMTRMKKKS